MSDNFFTAENVVAIVLVTIAGILITIPYIYILFFSSNTNVAYARVPVLNFSNNSRKNRKHRRSSNA